MDNFEREMNKIFSKDFTPPIRYKKAVEKAIEKAQYNNEKNKIFLMSNVRNMVASFAIGIIMLSGVTYAGVKLYENIWKKPKETNINEFLINNNDKNALLDETTLINLAIEEFKRIGYNNIKVESSEYIKNPYSNDILSFQVFAYNETDKNLSIVLNATTGKFISFGTDLDLQPQNYRDNRYNIEKKAKEIYIELGYEELEYELVDLVGNYLNDEQKSWFWIATFAKKYNNVVNKYEEISISFIPQINKVIILQEVNCDFENNDIVLTKDEAIEIAKNKEKELYQSIDNIEIDCKLDIEKMNSTIYMIENNIQSNFNSKNEKDETYTKVALKGAAGSLVINENKEIVVGDHVWFGANSKIYKGVHIGNNVVVAGNSVVVRPIVGDNLIIGGFPAKVLRSGIDWTV